MLLETIRVLAEVILLIAVMYLFCTIALAMAWILVTVIEMLMSWHTVNLAGISLFTVMSITYSLARQVP